MVFFSRFYTPLSHNIETVIVSKTKQYNKETSETIFNLRCIERSLMFSFFQLKRTIACDRIRQIIMSSKSLGRSLFWEKMSNFKRAREMLWQIIHVCFVAVLFKDRCTGFCLVSMFCILKLRL